MSDGHGNGAGTVPRVSVIVPAYNREHLLPEAIESVLAQTYGDWETLIVDDGSTDGTFEVAQSFERRAPERIRAIRLDRNQGIAAARMVAIRASRGGDLLCLLDSDDYWHEGYLERSVAVFDEARAAGRKVGIVSTNAHMLYPHGLTGETYFDRNGWPPDNLDLDTMLGYNYLLARAIFSRQAWDEAGGEFAPECRGSDDYDLWLRVMELGYDALAIREPHVVYRDHPGADSLDHLSRAVGVIACYERAIARGKLTPSQERRARAQITLFRALREREQVYRAVVTKRPIEAVRYAVRAIPLGLMAFAQGRSRWREWAGDLRQPGSNLRRVRALAERMEW